MPNYERGDKVKIVDDSRLGVFSGKEATIIAPGPRYTYGQAYWVKINGIERTINEGHFVGFTQPSFAHGERVYHRGRREYGTVVVHEKLGTDPTSVFVQFDGCTDILEVSKAMLEPQKAPK